MDTPAPADIRYAIRDHDDGFYYSEKGFVWGLHEATLFPNKGHAEFARRIIWSLDQKRKLDVLPVRLGTRSTRKVAYDLDWRNQP